MLYWAANDINLSREPVEVQATEPYIVGGHCQSGYWVDANRKTTLDGLYAAGDVSGGAPYKFVSGCWAEGVIAARAAGEYVSQAKKITVSEEKIALEEARTYQFLRHEKIRYPISPVEFEALLQKIMDQYAGGASTGFEMNEEMLLRARERLNQLPKVLETLIASDMHQLMKAHEVVDRIDVASVLVEHLLYRKETRWPSYQTRIDYPEKDDAHFLLFVNSRRDPQSGKIEMRTRPNIG